MAKSRILDRNFLDLDVVSNATVSSAQAAFPVSNLYNAQRRSKVWRSNGYWEITSVNNTIVFRETSLVNLTATIAEDEYTSDTTFFTAVKTALEDAGASTYTVERDTTTRKVKITSNGTGGGGIFELIWGSSTAGATLGYDTATSDTGTLIYLADEIRTGTSEWIKWDFGISTNPSALVLIGKRNLPIQLSATATVKLQGNGTDVWTDPEYEQTLTLDDRVISLFKAEDADGLHTEALRYWRVEILDLDNPNGYVELGSAFLGEYFEPTRGAVTFPFSGRYVDRSSTVFSEGGQTFSDIREKTEEFSLNWNGLTIEEKERIDEIFDAFGTSVPFFAQVDPTPAMATSANAYLRFVKFSNEPSYQLESPGNFNCSMDLREEL